MYYRNAQAAVVVYDITKAASLEKAKSWVKELQRQANPNIVIALAGNKLDLVQPKSTATGAASDAEDEPDDATATPSEAGAAESEVPRAVPTEEAQAYAQEAGLLFFETSAKTGEGVVELFTEIGSSSVTITCDPALISHQLIIINCSQEDPNRAHLGFESRGGTKWRTVRERGCEPTRRQPRRGCCEGHRCVQLLRYTCQSFSLFIHDMTIFSALHPPLVSSLR